MPVQLFRLKNVPEDEVREVCDLLSRHHIDYYETPAGNWGISMPAIWLNDEEQLEEAKVLIDEYQSQRLARVRDEREKRKIEGKSLGFFADFLKSPIQHILYAAVAAVVLYFSIKPFLEFGQ